MIAENRAHQAHARGVFAAVSTFWHGKKEFFEQFEKAFRDRPAVEEPVDKTRSAPGALDALRRKFGGGNAKRTAVPILTD